MTRSKAERSLTRPTLVACTQVALKKKGVMGLGMSETKKEIKVVNDQFGRPTYGIDLARDVLGKLNHPDFFEFNGYHYANKGVISWFEFATKIRDFSRSSRSSRIDSKCFG